MILKEGYRVERLQLSDKDRLESALAIYMVIAWRINRLIAQRGSFLGRKGDGEPGARTLWLGLQEIAIFVEGARFARQFSEAGTCV